VIDVVALRSVVTRRRRFFRCLIELEQLINRLGSNNSICAQSTTGLDRHDVALCGLVHHAILFDMQTKLLELLL
jgi:hypothetical protein